jgi:cell division septal protein FtsQ
MTVQVESTERFLRPIDAERVRRNYRHIQMQRLLAMTLNAAIVLAVLFAAVALVRRTQSDRRFAVRHVEITGAIHTPRVDLARVTQRYVGLNLFTLDIARLRRDLGGLDWVSRIEIEKKLPDTLRIRVVERTPSALTEDNGRIAYVDERGVAFAELSPAVGDADLPLIIGAQRAELGHCVALLRRLQLGDPQLYARISEWRPLPPRGFVFFDRELGTFVYAKEEDLSSKWRDLHAIVRAERFARGEIAYADLRFDGRVVLKPLRAMPAASIAPRSVRQAEITN